MIVKESTNYKYRFTNGGNPQDTVEGEGNYKQITLAMAGWLKSITLNGMIQIRIGRDLGSSKAGNESDDFMSMLEEVLNSAGSDQLELDPEGMNHG